MLISETQTNSKATSYNHYGKYPTQILMLAKATNETLPARLQELIFSVMKAKHFTLLRMEETVTTLSQFKKANKR